MSKIDKRKFDYFDKYTFLCEMYDEHAMVIRELVLHFFPFDDSIQVLDVKNSKTLVKRVQIPSIKLNMLQVGNIVNVFSKLILIVDCAPLTKRTLFFNVKSTFAMIKPIDPKHHGTIITFIMNHGFRIVNMKNGRLTKDLAIDMYRHMAGNMYMPLVIDYVTSDEVVGLELVAEDAVKKWRECLGNCVPSEAKPGTLRRILGESSLKNVAHGSESDESAQMMLQKFFGYKDGFPIIPFCATLKNCTCCIIKPHVLTDGNVGAIYEHIATSKDFYIAAMAMFSVEMPEAKEFYELYKGVVAEYEDMAIHLCEGKCIVLEVKCRCPDMNIVCEFRKLCGPRDPDIARQLYPGTIRALYGKNVVHNAVHCTDLSEEGELEVEYFFKLLANSKRAS